MCMPVTTGMQPYLYHCGCGCMVIPEIEEEDRRLSELRKIKG